MTDYSKLDNPELEQECIRLLGWTKIRETKRGWGGISPDGDGIHWSAAPHFTTDLNAVDAYLQRELAERGLLAEYVDRIYAAWFNDPSSKLGAFAMYLVRLGPRQRAEAFCAVMEEAARAA